MCVRAPVARHLCGAEESESLPAPCPGRSEIVKISHDPRFLPRVPPNLPFNPPSPPLSPILRLKTNCAPILI